MLLSFSQHAMLPYIEAGVRQARGADVGDVRVKRQTIRRMGPRYEPLLARAQEDGTVNGMDLHLWWKSRTPQRRRLGIVSCNIRRISITRTTDGNGDCVRSPLAGRGFACSVALVSDDVIARDDRSALAGLAYADGFDTIRAFADFFVPAPGDVFEGVMLKW
jgi:hypothetical protein